VLLEWAKEHGSTAPIEAEVERRRSRLQAEAFAYGERLYADKPGMFVRRIGRWWEASARTAPAETAHH
jgi:hypothetical protein